MNPVRENLVTEVRFEIEKDAEGYPKSRDAELLLCKPLNPDCSRCVVASVPFYLRNVAYGDTVSTRADAEGNLNFDKVIERGGHSVYRMYLHNGKTKKEVIQTLLDFGLVVEEEGNLIAFAVPPVVDQDAGVDYVLEGKSKGLWGAQDGYIHEE